MKVWEVKLWKMMDPSTREKAPQIAVTVLCNLPLPEDLKNAGDSLRKYAKL
jgi:1,4-dihydroxy-2-naphthoyl-CoA hydrolase